VGRHDGLLETGTGPRDYPRTASGHLPWTSPAQVGALGPAGDASALRNGGGRDLTRIHRSGSCCGVGAEVPGGEVRQRLIFEVDNDLLDDGVLAMLGLYDRDVLRAIGDEGEMSPVGPQLGLRTDQAGAPDDQPAVAVGRLGDLRLAFVGVVDALPGVLVDRLDRRADLLDQEVILVRRPDGTDPPQRCIRA